VDGAHNVCPSSHATRGNINVAINLVYAGPVTDVAWPCLSGRLFPSGERSMSEDINHDRRRFLGAAVMTIAAAEPVMSGAADAQSSKINPADATTMKPGTHTSFGSLK